MSAFLQRLIANVEAVKTLPWLMMAVFSLPLIRLAARKTYPRRRVLWLFIPPCVLSFVLMFHMVDWLVVLVVAADLTIVLLAAMDLLTLPARRFFEVDRIVGRIASLNSDHRVTVTINNVSQRSYHVSLKDDIPDEFVVTPEQFELQLEADSQTTVSYQIRSKRRGAFELEKIHVRVPSRFGLWNRYFAFPKRSTIHVYPDMKQLGQYALLARKDRLSLLGVRRTRKIGQDNEFERLRDFTRDDNYKHIDWRTTARRNKLTVKDYQTSQSQRIIFLIDCGRMMTNDSNGLSLLDHSLNATLMLSYVALRQGDSVGMICFSDRVHAFVPPGAGMNQMNQLLHAGFDRFPELVESRYDEAFLYLASHCKKRALVVLISNVVDEVNSHQIAGYLTNLVGRHLPVSVLLRDHQIFDAVDRPTDWHQAAVAAEILTWRNQVITDLRHRGVLSLDVFPEDMTAPLINQYLEVKARHLL